MELFVVVVLWLSFLGWVVPVLLSVSVASRAGMSSSIAGLLAAVLGWVGFALVYLAAGDAARGALTDAARVWTGMQPRFVPPATVPPSARRAVNELLARLHRGEISEEDFRTMRAEAVRASG